MIPLGLFNRDGRPSKAEREKSVVIPRGNPSSSDDLEDDSFESWLAFMDNTERGRSEHKPEHMGEPKEEPEAERADGSTSSRADEPVPAAPEANGPAPARADGSVSAAPEAKRPDETFVLPPSSSSSPSIG